MRGSQVRIGSLAVVSILAQTVSVLAITIDFEELRLPATGYHNSTGFTSHGAHFNNHYTNFGGGCCWEGFAYSNVSDTTTPGFQNQYAAFAGRGAGGSENYAVAFSGVDAGNGGFISTITLPVGVVPLSIEVTNNTFAALSMLAGDGFSKKFGGPTGNDPDWFRLRIVGLDQTEVVIGEVTTYLADYRFADNADDFVVDHWTTVELSSLAGATSLQIRLASSDIGPFGMNTPAYVAIDNLVLKTTLPGDFNEDGHVDAADFTVWRDMLGAEVAPFRTADANGDGYVDAVDYADWRSNFGRSTATASAHVGSVPEPRTMLILLMLFMSPFWRSCR